MWVDLDGTHVRFTTAMGRVKDRNLTRNPKVALAVQDAENPYGDVQVRGPIAESTEAGGEAHIDSLAKTYLGQARTPPASQARST